MTIPRTGTPPRPESQSRKQDQRSGLERKNAGRSENGRRYRLWRGTVISLCFHCAILLAILVVLPALPIIFFEETDLPSPAAMIVDLVTEAEATAGNLKTPLSATGDAASISPAARQIMVPNPPPPETGSVQAADTMPAKPRPEPTDAVQPPRPKTLQFPAPKPPLPKTSNTQTSNTQTSNTQTSNTQTSNTQTTKTQTAKTQTADVTSKRPATNIDIAAAPKPRPEPTDAVRPSRRNMQRFPDVTPPDSAKGTDMPPADASQAKSTLGAAPASSIGDKAPAATPAERALNATLGKIQRIIDRPELREKMQGSEHELGRQLTTRLQDAARRGYGFAEYRLAERYWSGRGVPQDRAEANRWLRRAAEHGFARAQLLLGLRAVRGDGGERDLGEADFWWSAAEKRGFSIARHARENLKRLMNPDDVIKARRLRRQFNSLIAPLVRLEDSEGSPNSLDGALRIASERGNIDEILRLLNAGADPNAPDGKGKTALINAAWRGRASAVALLMDLGTDPALTDDAARTPLMWSAINGHTRVTRIILKAGGSPDTRDAEGLTALMRAAWNGHTDVVSALIAGGADRTRRDPKGRSVRDFAVMGGNSKVLEQLQ